MNEESKLILNKEIIKLDRCIDEHTQDIEILFADIAEKTAFRQMLTKRRASIYEDLHA